VLREHGDDALAFARADLAFMRAVCKAARNVGLELFLNTFARWPDDHPQLVVALYDDCIRRGELYPAVIDLIRSRDGEAARSLTRRALEHMDDAWSRRYPPPLPLPLEPIDRVPGLAHAGAAKNGTNGGASGGASGANANTSANTANGDGA
jgi:hypothetical protein